MQKKGNNLKKYKLKGTIPTPLQPKEILYEESATEFFQDFHDIYKVVKGPNPKINHKCPQQPPAACSRKIAHCRKPESGRIKPS